MPAVGVVSAHQVRPEKPGAHDDRSPDRSRLGRGHGGQRLASGPRHASSSTRLITGGSRGLGRAIAEAFATAGAKVAFTFRTDTGDAEAARGLLGAWRTLQRDQREFLRAQEARLAELPALAGSLRSTLEPGDPAARDLRLAGKGFPGRGKHPAGDLVVHLQPVFPGKLNARQRKLLLQANAALLDEAAGSLPEIAAWNRQYLQR